MICPHCGREVDSTAINCPICGKALKNSGIKQKLLWSVLVAFLVAGAFYLYALPHLRSNTVYDIVEQQLKALKADQLKEAYYDYTSKDFQSANSFERFREFVHSLPVLKDYQKITFDNVHTEGDHSTLKAALETSGDLNGVILYELIQEGGKWKILGMEFTEYQASDSELSSATKALIEPVEGQMQALLDNDIAKAYNDYSSEQFKKGTTLEKFKTFISEYPALTQHHQYDYKEHYSEEDTGIVTILLNPDEHPLIIQYRLLKEKGDWKINSMRIRTISANKSQPDDAAGMIKVVEEQLEAIKQGDFKKAYHDYVGPSLQQEATLEDFKNFMRGYPAFEQHQSVNILEPYTENEQGWLTVELQSGKGKTVAEYVLEKDGNSWKVIGVHVTSSPEEEAEGYDTDSGSFKTRDLIGAIQTFLKEIQSKNLSNAYNLTSTQFRNENTLKAFEEFIKSHPEFFKSNSSTFEKLVFNNNIATIIGEIIHSDTQSLPVEFDLIQEEGQWKILHIFTHPVIDKSNGIGAAAESEKETSAKPMEFVKAIFGTHVDDNGNIADPSAVITNIPGDIYANVYVKNGVEGKNVDVLLRHVESGSSIPVIHASLQENGDTILTLIFSPPSKGWPVGTYQLKMSAEENKGEFKTFTFKVE